MQLRKLGAFLAKSCTVVTLGAGCSGEGEPDEPISEIGQALTTRPLYSGLLPDSRRRDHFYTDSYDEILAAQRNGWAYEGPRMSVLTRAESGPSGRAVPLLRYWHGSISDHFYTTDPGEGFNAERNGYVREQPAGYNPYVFTYQAPGTCPVYRLYSGSPMENHFYTMSESEATAAATQPGCVVPCYLYKREGIRFYAYPYNASTCPP